MCRSIHTLYHIQSPVSQAEIRAAALQYVRKISGYTVPSKANEGAFISAVDEIEAASSRLLASLQTNAPVRARSSIIGSRS
jgi:hypothetical protein